MKKREHTRFNVVQHFVPMSIGDLCKTKCLPEPLPPPNVFSLQLLDIAPLHVLGVLGERFLATFGFAEISPVLKVTIEVS
uniref:Uncharacterized protein n=1 Tax=Nelumbo nucifera TaxID=4432 RepID=A0A823A320_NELNU|nr:TPA_asm: hypothetical protein HUJ06_018415 [Nelumbo nucifera]